MNTVNTYRFKLEKYKGKSTRYYCPACGKRDFARYIDTASGEHIFDTVGRCNRLNNCGYHYTPKDYFKDNNISIPTYQPAAYNAPMPQPDPPASTIPQALFAGSLKRYEANNFVNFLLSRFDVNTVTKAVERYYIGTSKHWNGSNIFWQVDLFGKIRTGKIMLYNATTGKRVKEPQDYITWVHKAAKLPAYNLKQCLFGEHLLTTNTAKPVGIVESEKTAVIASIYLPQLVWVAVGSLQNISKERCKAIAKSRQVILYPDADGFAAWEAKGKELGYQVSTILEKAKQAGYFTTAGAKADLADYLLLFDVEAFNANNNPQTPNPTPAAPAELNHVTELECIVTYFESIKPPCPMWVENNFWLTTETNISEFLHDCIKWAKEHTPVNPNNVYFETLRNIKDWITKQVNQTTPNQPAGE